MQLQGSRQRQQTKEALISTTDIVGDVCQNILTASVAAGVAALAAAVSVATLESVADTGVSEGRVESVATADAVSAEESVASGMSVPESQELKQSVMLDEASGLETLPYEGE